MVLRCTQKEVSRLRNTNAQVWFVGRLQTTSKLPGFRWHLHSAPLRALQAQSVLSCLLRCAKFGLLTLVLKASTLSETQNQESHLLAGRLPGTA